MIRKHSALVVLLGIGMAIAACPLPAQDDSGTAMPAQRSSSLLDKLGDFGRSVFGSRPNNLPRSSANANQQAMPPYVTSNNQMPPNGQVQIIEQAPSNGQPQISERQMIYPPASPGSAPGADLNTTAEMQPGVGVPALQAEPQEQNSPMTVPNWPSTPRPVRRWAVRANDDRAAPPSDPPTTVDSRTNSRGAATASTPVSSTPSGYVPLYERVRGFRQSAFGDSPTPSPVATPNVAGSTPGVTSSMSPSPASSSNPDQAPYVVPAERPTSGYRTAGRVQSEVSTPRVSDTPASADWPSSTPSSVTTPSTVSAAAVPSKSPTLAPAVAPAITNSSVDKPATAKEPLFPTAVRSTQPAASNVLLTRQGPYLTSETIGPRRISVGRESSYEVTIQNSADVPAEELVLYVGLPTWADIVATDASTGNAETLTASTTTREVQWKLGRLDGKSRQRLVLKIIPRESRPFDLAVRWDYRPMSTQAAIEVQEPKLTIRLEGPREVLYGHKDVYKIRVSNSGNGDAENTLIRLFPAGGGEQSTASYSFGTIAAGAEKAVEVELTSRQAGNLTMKMEVQCDGGGRAELSEPLLVRRAVLQLDVDGPKLQYADTIGTFRIRVANPGTAPARQASIVATLPPGAKYVSCTEKGEWQSAGSAVRWKVDTLAPGSEKVFEVKCHLSKAGENRLEISGKADDDLTAAAVARTRVETMADLVLEVIDPPGPIALGEDVVYELRIANRGTKSAEQVAVIALFSEGMEPVSAHGLPNRISVGQVNFNAIPTLPPGKDIRVKISARAQTAGSHIFRAELHCRPLGTRLIREETTHFFASDSAAPPAVVGTGTSENAVRTADRRAPEAQDPAPVKERPTSAQPR